MDENSEKCIEEQLKLIEDISEIIKTQISDIDNAGRSIILLDAVEDLKRANILNTKRLYLEFFNDIVNFLLSKLREERKENFRFLLLNIRTLLDIYGQLLYLCNQDENKQASICMANLLFTLANTVGKPEEKDSEAQKQAYEGVRESYNKNYRYYKPFLDREGINIPEDMELFSRRKLEKKLKLNFPPLSQILKKEIIETSSPETIKFFPKISHRIYNTYKFTSNYIHGNVLAKSMHGNEKLWIIAEVQMLSSLVVDLINTKILKGSRKAELIGWLEKLSQKRPEFVNFWQERNRNT